MGKTTPPPLAVATSQSLGSGSWRHFLCLKKCGASKSLSVMQSGALTRQTQILVCSGLGFLICEVGVRTGRMPLTE